VGRRATGIAVVVLLAVLAGACGGTGTPVEGLPDGTGAAGFAAATLHLTNSSHFLQQTPYATGATTPKAIQAHLTEFRTAVHTFDLTFIELDRRSNRGRAGSSGVVLAGWNALLRLSAETRRRNLALQTALTDPLTLQSHECDLQANQQLAQRQVEAMDAVVTAAHAIEKAFPVTTEYAEVDAGDAAAQRAESTVTVAMLCLEATRMATAAAPPAAKTATARATRAPKVGRADLKALDEFVRKGVPVSAPGRLVDAREALLAYLGAAQEPPSPVAESRERHALQSLREIMDGVRYLVG
jgi:hypothetical protein